MSYFVACKAPIFASLVTLLVEIGRPPISQDKKVKNWDIFMDGSKNHIYSYMLLYIFLWYNSFKYLHLYNLDSTSWACI